MYKQLKKIIYSASVSCMNPLFYQTVIKKLDEEMIQAYHFDICDGHFDQTFLLAPLLLKALRPITNRRFDVHLYCYKPSLYIDELVDAGANLIVVQLESKDDPKSVIKQINKKGIKSGLGVLPYSTIPNSIKDIIFETDVVVINTVSHVFSGQTFDPRGLINMEKINKIILREGLKIEIVADGNVCESHINDLLIAGSTHFVCGTSSIFKTVRDPALCFRSFRKQVERQNKKLFLE
jgi:ribulose-phosphate 3-epimerase